MQYVILKEIKKCGNRCEYVFDYPKILSTYITDPSQNLYVEFPENCTVANIPDAIMAIPFVGSMMCATMMFNIGIQVPEIDKKFFESIPHIKEVYKKMFPYTEFCLELLAKKIVDCSYETYGNPSIFFSGGLDATSALVDIIDQKPLMINIYGGDLLLTDMESHEALDKYFTKLAKQVGNEYVFVKSNCRRYFNEYKIECDVLNRKLKHEDNHGWWASIAHILSMASVIAPVEYNNGASVHYVGSSYPVNSIGFDANNIDMVNAIKYASCSLKMVDEHLERDEKARKIISYCKEHNLKVELKVCWHAKASENCSRCEKCYRTILEIVANHADPNDYGFNIDHKGYMQMKRFVKYHEVNSAFWKANQEQFKKEADYWKKNSDLAWFVNIDFNNPRRIAVSKVYLKVRKFLGQLKQIVLR